MQHLASCTRVWVGKTPSLLMVRREMDCNILSPSLEFDWVRVPPCYGQEISGLQDLESCTGVCVGKTPSLLLGWREVVCNIWSHALEFEWVRLPPCDSAGGKWFGTSEGMYWSLGG